MTDSFFTRHKTLRYHRVLLGSDGLWKPKTPLGIPEEWANESFRLAKKVWVKDGGSVGDEYYQNNLPILDRQLELAGLRLAIVLNQALGK